MPGFNKALASNERTAWKLKKEEDFKKMRGMSDLGAQEGGIQRFAPLTYNGQRLPPSAVYSGPQGEVKVYDQVVNVIDSDFFNYEVNMVYQRRLQLEQMAFKFIHAGDAVTKKYMGIMFSLLGAGQLNNDKFKKWCKLDGYDDTQIATIASGEHDVDCRPSTISLHPSMSKEFTLAIDKFILVLKFYSVIFTGETPLKNPDSINTITQQVDGDGVRAETSAAAVGEIVNQRKVNANLFN